MASPLSIPRDRFPLAGLTAAVREAIEATRARYPRSRARAFTEADVPRIVAAVVETVEARRADDVVGTVTVCGGFIPGGYARVAMTDVVTVVLLFDTGGYHVTGGRRLATVKQAPQSHRIVGRLSPTIGRAGRVVFTQD